MGCLLTLLLLLQMLSALTAAGLGAQEVEYLWACYEKAKAAEEKAGFATGQQQQSSLLGLWHVYPSCWVPQHLRLCSICKQSSGGGVRTGQVLNVGKG